MKLQKNAVSRDSKKPWVFLLSDATMMKGKRYEVHKTGITLRQGVNFSKEEVAKIAKEFLRESTEFGVLLSATIVESKIQAALSAAK